MEAFVLYKNGALAPRWEPTLPWIAAPNALPPCTSFQIAVMVPHAFPLLPGEDADTVKLLFDGKVLAITRSAEPLLRYLMEQRVTTKAAVIERFRGELDEAEIVDFLRLLAVEGVIACTLPEPAFEEKQVTEEAHG
jgi:hypothetical protein